MLDRIFVEDYRKDIEIGVFHEEHGALQPVSFSVSVALEAQTPTSDDDVDDILSYDVIVEAIEACLAQKRYNLLEMLAEDISARLVVLPKLSHCDVEIRKIGRIEGALGVAIRRFAEGKAELPKSAPLELLHIVYENVNSAALDLPKDAVILPMISGEARGEAARHIFALRLDQRAWEIGASRNMSVVDTQTEADSLRARGIGFVRAFGKSPFAHRPEIAVFNEERLIAWAQESLNAMALRIHKQE